MCLYVGKMKPDYPREDIITWKLLVSYDGKEFHPYFNTKYPIEFDKILENDKSIVIEKTEKPFPYNIKVKSGVFHTFADKNEILNYFYSNLVFPWTNNVYICQAIIPKGCACFHGFSHSLTKVVEETYGSSKIKYVKQTLEKICVSGSILNNILI